MGKKLMIIAHHVKTDGMTKDQAESYIANYKEKNFVEHDFYDVKNLLIESTINEVRILFPLQDNSVKINTEKNVQRPYKKPYNANYKSTTTYDYDQDNKY